MPKGADYNLEVVGIEQALKSFQGLEKEVRRNANGDIRKASRLIAEKVPSMLGGSSAPQERSLIRSAGPKSDRYVVVQLSKSIPDLAGMKRQRVSTRRKGLTGAQIEANKAKSKALRRSKKSLGWALELNSPRKQFHRPGKGALVGRNKHRILQYAGPKYVAELQRIMAKYGLR